MKEREELAQKIIDYLCGRGGFDDWWGSPCKVNGVLFEQAEIYGDVGISKEGFFAFPFRNGFNTGDLMILKSTKRIALGDVIVFQPQDQPEPIIHRAIRVEENEGAPYYTTKGDHNCGSSSSEQHIPESEVIGEAAFRVPFLGMVKLAFVRLLQVFGVM